MSEEFSQDILSVQAIGSEIYNALRQETFMDEKISDTIHRTSVKGLYTTQKKTLYIHSKARKHMVAGSQEHYLFDEDGFMRKAQRNNNTTA